MKYGILLAAAMTVAGCAQQAPEAAPRPPQAGQPINSVEMAARMTALRASALVGDQKGVEQQMGAMHSDLMRSMKVPDASRTIDK